MDYPLIQAKPRDLTGKSVARKIRALGYIPAIVYGKGMPPLAVVVNPKQVVSAVREANGPNPVVRLQVGDGEQMLAVVRQYEVHPVRRTLVHCDFLRVSEDTMLTVEVPLRLVGKSEGEKSGAKLSNPVSRVRVRCKVSDIPAAIDLDISGLRVGQAVMLSEIVPPPGVRILCHKDVPVVLVKMGRATKEVEVATESAEKGKQSQETKS